MNCNLHLSKFIFPPQLLLWVYIILKVYCSILRSVFLPAFFIGENTQISTHTHTHKWHCKWKSQRPTNGWKSWLPEMVDYSDSNSWWVRSRSKQINRTMFCCTVIINMWSHTLLRPWPQRADFRKEDLTSATLNTYFFNSLFFVWTNLSISFLNAKNPRRVEIHGYSNQLTSRTTNKIFFCIFLVVILFMLAELKGPQIEWIRHTQTRKIVLGTQITEIGKFLGFFETTFQVDYIFQRAAKAFSFDRHV